MWLMTSLKRFLSEREFIFDSAHYVKGKFSNLLFLQGSVRPVEQKVEYFNGNRCPIWYDLPRNEVFNIFDREYLYGDFNRP